MFTVVGFGNESYGRPPLNFATLHLFFSRIVQNSGITLKMTEFLTDCVPKMGGTESIFFHYFSGTGEIGRTSETSFFQNSQETKIK